MPTVGPLRSTGVTPLPRYYGPLRLPTQPQVGYVFPTHVADNSSATSGLPGSSADLCVRAVPNHPGRSDGCSRSFLPHRRRASPNPEDWPLSIGVTRPTRVRLRYGSHARSTGLRILDYSSNRLLLYLVNEQLPGIPPLRYPDQLDLSWRSGWTRRNAEVGCSVCGARHLRPSPSPKKQSGMPKSARAACEAEQRGYYGSPF
jgi:hypothetical protein